MKLSNVLAAAALTVTVGGASVAHAVDAETTPEKPAVTAKAETPKEGEVTTPKTDKVETPKEDTTKPVVETPKVEKGKPLVQEEKPAFPEEKIKELKAEQDKADAKAKENKKADAKDTAKKPLPKTSAVK